jgi:hypothetical protein
MTPLPGPARTCEKKMTFFWFICHQSPDLAPEPVIKTNILIEKESE